MISQRLYDLAFEFNQTEIWKKLWDKDVFAVQLSGDRTGYVSIMGNAGEHYALGLYIGPEGLKSYLDVASTDWSKVMMDDRKHMEVMLKQNCLQCSFEKKDLLTDEEIAETEKYAKKHHIELGEGNAYPMFKKYLPDHYPWFVNDAQDQQDLCDALEMTIALSAVMEKKNPREFGIYQLNEKSTEIMRLQKQGNGFILQPALLPALEEDYYVTPKFEDEIAKAGLEKMDRNGIWECQITRCPEPFQNTPEEAPCFPMLLMVVEQESGYMLPVSVVEDYKKEADEMIASMAEAFKEVDMIPELMMVADEATFFLLQDFCKVMNIPMSLHEELPVLMEAQNQFYQDFMSEEDEIDIGRMLEELKDMPEEVLEQFPQEIQDLYHRVMGGQN